MSVVVGGVVERNALVKLVPTATRVELEIAVKVIGTAEAITVVTLAQMETTVVQANNNKDIMDYELSRCRIGLKY